MYRTTSLPLRTCLATVFLLAACSDGIAPDRSSTGASLLQRAGTPLGLLAILDDPGGVVTGTVARGFLVAPAIRLAPLATDATWSFVAGPDGATSSHAGSGLTIVVPAGALASTQTITVTALAGPAIAYRFQPHGLRFDRPVDLHQSLDALAPTDAHLRGAYFPDDVPAVDPLSGLTIVSELEPTKLDRTAGLVRVRIRHFSGYIVASGRSGARDGETSGGYE